MLTLAGLCGVVSFVLDVLMQWSADTGWSVWCGELCVGCSDAVEC